MIKFISNLPLVGNCFKSDEPSEKKYRKRLKQPTQIKVTTIRELDKTLTKVIAIALIVLLIFGIFIPLIPMTRHDVRPLRTNNSLNRIPTYLQPYMNQLSRTVIPKSSQPITTFPSYLQKVMYPGKMSGGDGRLCVIPESMPTFEECQEVSTILEEDAKKNHPSRYHEYTTDPSITLEKGGRIEWRVGSIDTSIKRIYVGMDKRKVTAYQEALFFVEQEVLNSHDFFEKDASAIVGLIKKTNALITNYICEIPGQLRNQISMLLNDNIEINRENFRKIFLQRGGSPNLMPVFDSLYDQLEKYDLVDRALSHLTRKERKVLNTLGYITCPPKEIEPRLNKLAKQIKELAPKVKNKQANAIAAAAFVYLELITINPFMFGNGRTGLLLMNLILLWGGFNAIVIPDKDKHMAEVIKDRHSPGTFVSYLEWVIEWNRKQDNLK